MVTIYVDRRTWVRGSKVNLNNTSRLMNSSGNKCCVGFVCLARGLTSKEIYSYPYVFGVFNSSGDKTRRKIKMDKILREFTYSGSMVPKIYSVNDSVKISDKEREATLKSLFKEIGVDIRFRY